MTATEDSSGSSVITPTDAFALLGDRTRLRILQVLGQSGEPLQFEELRSRVGYEDSANFSYHLSKLSDHFITKTDHGYDLTMPGRSVVEAVLAGAITETPEINPITINESCQYCGSSIEVLYRDEALIFRCTECPGSYGETSGRIKEQRIGYFPFPPGGLTNRSVEEIVDAAYVWGGLEMMGIAYGVCPKCGGAIEKSVEVCEDHRLDDGLCPNCNQLKAVTLHATCLNCNRSIAGMYAIDLLSSEELRAFLLDHGIDYLSPPSQAKWGAALAGYGEEIDSHDPFRATFTFSIGDESLALTVDDQFNVVESR